MNATHLNTSESFIRHTHITYSWACSELRLVRDTDFPVTGKILLAPKRFEERLKSKNILPKPFLVVNQLLQILCNTYASDNSCNSVMDQVVIPFT